MKRNELTSARMNPGMLERFPHVLEDMLSDQVNETYPRELPTVIAGNNSMDWKIALVVYLISALGSGLLGYGLHLTKGTVYGVLAFSICFISLFVGSLLVVSGDIAALFDSLLRNLRMGRSHVRETRTRTEVINAIVRIREIEASERIAELEAQANTALDRDSVRKIQEDVAYLLANPGSPREHVGLSRHTELVADLEISAAREACHSYLGTLFNADNSTTDRVSKSGFLIGHPLPWNSDWSAEPWKDKAKEMLTDGSASPLARKGTGWVLKYPTLAECVRNLKPLQG